MSQHGCWGTPSQGIKIGQPACHRFSKEKNVLKEKNRWCGGPIFPEGNTVSISLQHLSSNHAFCCTIEIYRLIVKSAKML